MRNYWVEHAPALAAAYLQGDSELRFAVVTRAIAEHLGASPARVLDIGGGHAQQALRLARLGHHVTVLDIDPAMLEAARSLLQREDSAVRCRVRLVLGPGEHADLHVGSGFDLVCCHSVLMYLEDPDPMLRVLVKLAREGGLLSILSLNSDAVAMRSGLQGRWRESIEGLRKHCEAGSTYLPTSEPSLSDVCAELQAAGARLITWYGVGVFTDHLTEPIVAVEPDLVIEAEWLAGRTDPYRGVARCYHLIARNG